MFAHHLCGANVESAWFYGKPVLVDALPHADGTLIVYRQQGQVRAERAQPTPYARREALYRQHVCRKPSAE